MNLSKILLPSHSVEIKVMHENEEGKPSELHLNTIISEGLDKDLFTILTPVYKGVNFNLHLQDQIDVLFKAQSDASMDVYAIKCEVIQRRVQEGMPQIVLKRIGEPKKVQRRQAFRINIYNTYKLYNSENTFEVSTKDISSTGMLALSSKKMPQGDIFTFQMDTNTVAKDQAQYKKNKIIEIECKILGSSYDSEIRKHLNRIQFLNLSPAQNQLILQYLYAKQAEILRAQPKRGNQISTPTSSRFHEDWLKLPSKVQILSLTAMILTFFAGMFIVFAQPESIYGLDIFWHNVKHTSWNPFYLGASILTSLILLVICAFYQSELKKNDSKLKSAVYFASVGFFLLLINFFIIALQLIFNSSFF